MKYIVTGGAGFIGSNLACYLAQERNDEVIIIDNLSSGKIDNIKDIIDLDNVTFIKESITNQDALNEIFSGADGVFHKAAAVSVPLSIEEPYRTHNLNVTGTLNVLTAARNAGVRKVIIASSAAIYGDDPTLPKHEDMIPKPLSPYAVTKLAGEYYAGIFNDLYGLKTASLRYFNVFGPKQDPSSQYSGVISIFAESIANEKPITIYGDGLQTRDFIYVEDVVRANIMAMESNAEGVYNIATGKETTLIQLASILMEMTGNYVRINFNNSRPGDIKRSIADISKAVNDFGFNTKCSLKEGLVKLINY